MRRSIELVTMRQVRARGFRDTKAHVCDHSTPLYQLVRSASAQTGAREEGRRLGSDERVAGLVAGARAAMAGLAVCRQNYVSERRTVDHFASRPGDQGF